MYKGSNILPMTRSGQFKRRANVYESSSFRAPSLNIRVYEGYQPNPLSGPREACEDSVCSDCQTHASSGQYAQYKQCKKTCFEERKDDINTCCMDRCGGLFDQAECIATCTTPMYYGE